METQPRSEASQNSRSSVTASTVEINMAQRERLLELKQSQPGSVEDCLGMIRDNFLKNVVAIRQVSNVREMRAARDSHNWSETFSKLPAELQHFYGDWADKKVTMMRNTIVDHEVSKQQFSEISRQFYNDYARADVVMGKEIIQNLVTQGKTNSARARQIASKTELRHALCSKNRNRNYEKFFMKLLESSRQSCGFKQVEQTQSVDEIMDFIGGEQETGSKSKTKSEPKGKAKNKNKKKNRNKKLNNKSGHRNVAAAKKPGVEQATTSTEGQKKDQQTKGISSLSVAGDTPATQRKLLVDQKVLHSSVHPRVARWSSDRAEDIRQFEDRRQGVTVKQYESMEIADIRKMRMYHHLPDLHKVLANNEIREHFTTREEDRDGGFTLIMLAKLDHFRNDKNPDYGYIRVCFAKNPESDGLTIYHSMFDRLPDGVSTVEELARHGADVSVLSSDDTQGLNEADPNAEWFTANSKATFELFGGGAAPECDRIKVAFEKSTRSTAPLSESQKEPHSVSLYRLR